MSARNESHQRKLVVELALAAFARKESHQRKLVVELVLAALARKESHQRELVVEPAAVVDAGWRRNHRRLTPAAPNVVTVPGSRRGRIGLDYRFGRAIRP
ncbi:hypothetical protein [Thermopirellula anaerolimosa]